MKSSFVIGISIGFSIVFIVLGTFAGFIGATIGPWRMVLGRAAGAIIIVFGLTMLGLVEIPLLTKEWRMHVPKFLRLGHPESSALIGVLFALGWSPCIGPIFGTILFVASTSDVLSGAFLLGVFSFGLGLPFILSAIFIDKLSEWFSHMGHFTTTLSYIGGVALVLIGVLMLLGEMGLLVTWGFNLFDVAGYGGLLQHL